MGILQSTHLINGYYVNGHSIVSEFNFVMKWIEEKLKVQ